MRPLTAEETKAVTEALKALGISDYLLFVCLADGERMITTSYTEDVGRFVRLLIGLFRANREVLEVFSGIVAVASVDLGMQGESQAKGDVN